MTQNFECATEKARNVDGVLATDLTVSVSPTRKATLTELAQRLGLTFWQHAPLPGGDFIVVSVEARPDQGECR